jgi:hypothetical protein
MGKVEDFSDYHIEFNLDQQLDQRTYNKPLTSEVAAVWVEGSEHRGQFENSVVLHGKDGSWKGIRSYHGSYDPLSYPLFFPRGEFGWHNCIPKVGVTEAQVNKARAIRKQRAQGAAMMKQVIAYFLLTNMTRLPCIMILIDSFPVCRVCR